MIVAGISRHSHSRAPAAREAAARQHRALYTHWNAVRGDRWGPFRSDLDLREIVGALPNLVLADMVGDQFRYRVMGTAVARDLGRDFTGTIIGANSERRYAAALVAIYARVRDTRCPAFASTWHMAAAASVRFVSRLLLPLTLGGTDVEMVLMSRALVRDDRAAHRMLVDHPEWNAERDGMVETVETVDSADHLEDLCVGWEQAGTASGRAPLPAR